MSVQEPLSKSGDKSGAQMPSPKEAGNVNLLQSWMAFLA